VQEAYETLRDDSKRTNYDRQYQDIQSQWTRYRQAMGRWQQKQSEREPQNLKQEWERQVVAEKVATERSRREREHRQQRDREERERAEKERERAGKDRQWAERERLITEDHRRFAARLREKDRERAEAERLLREAEAESRTEVVLERARYQQAQRAQERLAAEREAEREAERAAARMEGATKLAAAIFLFGLAHSLLGIVVLRFRQ
jgi:hypothetical protein